MAEPRSARRPRPAPEREGGQRWQASPRPPPRGLDAGVLLVLVDALRRAVPRELEAQLTTLLRELLLTLRSLIDWYLERLDEVPREPEVEEIPID